MASLLRIHETCLYADDLGAMEQFYTGVLGLRKVSEMSPRGLTLRVNAQSVLLIFNPQQTKEPHPLVPSHGATGPGHCAFTIEPRDLDAWRKHLASSGKPIEKETTWETGAISLYFRDPAGNSIELIAGELWPS
jgi:catechol-2,3-dioxygenase